MVEYTVLRRKGKSVKIVAKNRAGALRKAVKTGIAKNNIAGIARPDTKNRSFETMWFR